MENDRTQGSGCLIDFYKSKKLIDLQPMYLSDIPLVGSLISMYDKITNKKRDTSNQDIR